MKEKLFSKTKIKLIEKTVHQYLLAIVGKAWEFGQGEWLEQDELGGILPYEIEAMIKWIDVPRMRDNTYNEIMRLRLTTGQVVTVLLSESERGQCSAHYAYLSIRSMLDAVAANYSWWVSSYEARYRDLRKEIFNK